MFDKFKAVLKVYLDTVPEGLIFLHRKTFASKTECKAALPSIRKIAKERLIPSFDGRFTIKLETIAAASRPQFAIPFG
jgi:hypothetical protein